MSKGTLLVGGAGLLGSGLATLLSQEPKQVLILEGVLPGQKDLVPKNTDEVIFVVHPADYRNPKMSPELFFANTGLLVQLLQEAAERGVARFAYCSSGSVYAASSLPHNEDSPLMDGHLSPYIATKLAAELLLKAWTNFFQRLIILRPFFNYGPGQNSKMLFANMLSRVIRGEEIRLRNGKGLVFNPIYVSDAVRFILHVLRMKDGFDIYNVAGHQTLTLFDVVSEMARLADRKPCLTFPDGREDIVLADTGKMRLTGFKPSTDIKAGLRAMYISYAQKDTVYRI